MGEGLTKNQLIAIVAVFVVLIVAGAMIKVNQANNVSNQFSDKIKSTTYTYNYEVTVESTHIIFGADFELYADGKLTKSFRLEPGQGIRFTLSKSYEGLQLMPYVKLDLVSRGGGFGTQSDSVTLYLKNGETVKTTLRA
ncbi:MAG: hypothetical protein FWH44_05095 [Methanomassiliicoccaceae archaeon]|nr:hypothetical protein [Methanomassiliicoccaceae archaeon]